MIQVKHDEGPDVVIAAGLRSPWVRAGGAFGAEDAGHLGSQVMRELLVRTGIEPGAGRLHKARLDQPNHVNTCSAY